MAEKNNTAAAIEQDGFREAVCIHTSKVFDSCKDKDCIEDLRVYPLRCSQAIIDSAFSIRPRSAKLLFADVRVEDISFNRGCYTVDVTYFYKVTGEAFPGEQIVTGLAIFDKSVILYGSEGSSKVFTSKNRRYSEKAHGNLPTAVVEAVDPLVLSMKIVDCSVSDELDFESREIPSEISACFNDQIITSRVGKQLYVTLGQFSIIRLERSTQLLIPMYDYCIPCKECAGGGEEDPCTLFNHIPFPISDFYPPKESPDRCTSGIC